DQNDVATGAIGGWLSLHSDYGGTDDAEDAVEVSGESIAPLGCRHGADWLVVRRPDAVIEDGAVEGGECCDGCGNEGFAVFWSEERLLDGAAQVGAAALGGEGFSLSGSGAVAEDDLCA